MDVRPFPFAQLRRRSRRAAARETAIARWLAARVPRRLAQIAGAPVRARMVGTLDATHAAFDPHAAVAELRIAGERIAVFGASRPVRELAQRLLGGPDELAAPRPLTAAEHAVWAMVVAAAIEDAGIAGEVWPGGAPAPAIDGIELAIEAGDASLPALVCFPPALVVRPPPRAPAAWTALQVELVVAVGRCALPVPALAALALRDVIAIEPAVGRGQAPTVELVIGPGAVALACTAGAMEARIASEYSARDMTLPDDAHLELTVALGTTALSLRELAELVVGAVVPLGRPLAGPFELRAAGRVIGHGELVDLDGELGVRVVSLG